MTFGGLHTVLTVFYTLFRHNLSFLLKFYNYLCKSSPPEFFCVISRFYKFSQKLWIFLNDGSTLARPCFS